MPKRKAPPVWAGPHTEVLEVSVTGSKFDVARMMAHHGIPFAFHEEYGDVTTGFVGKQFKKDVDALKSEFPWLITGIKTARVQRRNPSRSIRSTRRRVALVDRFRGRTRFSETRYPRDMAGTLGYYHVQVRRGNRWLTLATFPRDSLTGKLGMARATEYGKLLARRYPRQKFRVFWPDMRKNPRSRAVPWYISKKPDGAYTLKQTSSPTRENWLEAFGPFSSRDEASAHLKHLKLYTRRAKGDYARYRAGKPPRKNPAPRADRVNGAEVDQAARLFQQFTGHRVTKARQVNLPRPKVGLAIGPVLGISYATTRDGKRENYQHDFRRGARPLLAVSQDGRTLMLLGGGHRFTPRGIVDKPR